MSAVGQRKARERCGRWMPRKKAYCARMLGHKDDCRTAEALLESRRQTTERRWGKRRRDDPAARARWKRKFKLAQLGITEDEFDRMLERQNNACAMCLQPFGDAYPQVDHDHNCCPAAPDGHARSCGKCIRGLLCFRCNTALGYVEKYGDIAADYLKRARRRRIRVV